MKQELKDELQKWYRQMQNDGEFIPKSKLPQYYQTFRDKFGPEKLQRLDGDELLITMHERGNRDSLVYWLEFKNDDEFPSVFGGIQGGSAHKFGIFRKKETGEWVTGSSNNSREISEKEAIEIARRQRDQLVKGAELLEALTENADDAIYEQLQEDLNRDSPDVADSAWGHKYFSLLFPDKLDDYHREDYQKFHLIRLLQEPPEGSGRFICAGRFVAAASEMGIPINHLTTLLNKRNGRPYRYWRVELNSSSQGWESRWDQMYQSGYIAIGWKDLGDLSSIDHSIKGKRRIQEFLQSTYNETSGTIKEDIYSFIATMEANDVVLALDQNTVVGIGRIAGGYYHEPTDQFTPHHRPVYWYANERWPLPVGRQSNRKVRGLKVLANHLEIEKWLFASGERSETPRRTQGTSGALSPLYGIPGKISSVLKRKKQVILHGPPGTGKTYWARHTAAALAARSWFGKDFVDLSAEEKLSIVGHEGTGGAVRLCTFHPAYGYEDFIEGYRPEKSDAEQMVFTLKKGIFRSLCEDAKKSPDKNFYLVIDEINRGDIPRIFGELITLLENDKRGISHQLPLSKEAFAVPENVYLIGTMNTADRSIALLDTALRRRFGFIELMPDYRVLGDVVLADSIPIAGWLEKLNYRILEHIGKDARNLQIGHAYLMERGRPVSDMERFTSIVEEDIVPLLQEYCYEDYPSLAEVLGEGLVDTRRQRIRYELFDPDQRDSFIQNLLAASPELTTSPQIVEQEEYDEENGDEEE